jgi:hypothetical protein
MGMETEAWLNEREALAACQICPRCGNSDAVPILWGEPADLPEYARIFIGGCLIPPPPVPDLICRACDLMWASDSIDRRRLSAGPRCSAAQVRRALDDLRRTRVAVAGSSLPEFTGLNHRACTHGGSTSRELVNSHEDSG